MDKKQLVILFNEWMRRFTDEPERFAHEFESVQKFLSEHAEGKEPSYGEECVAYICKLDSELPMARVELKVGPGTDVECVCGEKDCAFCSPAAPIA